MRVVLVPTAGAAFMVTTAQAWAQATSDVGRYPWGGMMGWGGGWYGMFFGPLMMILVLVVVVVAVAFLTRWPAGPWQGSTAPHHPPSGHSPLDILKERFARGEIDKDEYEERRRILSE